VCGNGCFLAFNFFSASCLLLCVTEVYLSHIESNICYSAPVPRKTCVCLLKQDKCVIYCRGIRAANHKVVRYTMGAAASVTSDRSDEKISVRTAEDLCDAGCGTIAYPSPKGSAPHSLCSLSSPTGLFDAEVPIGTIPGQLFDISIDGKKFSIRCPSGKLPGDLISFTVGSGTSLRKVLTGKQSKQLIVVE
jgi:hypothetical protein